eukprot:Sspe_Gene.19941::Locus_7290_Transcript_1_1_Confidence_1.000_Length_1089::g.19941::m.19941
MSGMKVSEKKVESTQHLLSTVLSLGTAHDPAVLGELEGACQEILTKHSRRVVAEYVHGSQVVLLDIEGTTTPIPFVTTVLFPYAEEAVEDYVTNNYDDLTDVITAMRKQALDDGKAVPQIPKEDQGRDKVVAGVVANVRHNSQQNRKLAPLKELQGRIWKEGYAAGKLKGKVFDDVPRALRRWKEMGLEVHIFSSGSVPAQKLLFGYSDHGDLLPYISGHHDLTTAGNKRVSDSYTAIAKSLKVKPESVVFLTDQVGEAVAAREAKMRPILLNRPENLRLPPEEQGVAPGFLQLLTFDDLFPSSKRHRDE